MENANERREENRKAEKMEEMICMKGKKEEREDLNEEEKGKGRFG